MVDTVDSGMFLAIPFQNLRTGGDAPDFNWKGADVQNNNNSADERHSAFTRDKVDMLSKGTNVLMKTRLWPMFLEFFALSFIRFNNLEY